MARYYTAGAADAIATVKNTTISATDNALEIYGNAANTSAGEAKLMVENGHFTGGIDINDGDTIDDKCKIIISGGYFTDDPNGYLPEGKTIIASDLPEFSFIVAAIATVTVTFDSGVDKETYTVTEAGNTTLPTASKPGCRFTGWKFDGIDGTYKELNSTLWQALTIDAPNDSAPIDVAAKAQFEYISNPFSDVSATAYYYDAVFWAAKNNITTGTTATTFSPEDGCTRGHAVTFLWRAMDSPEPTVTVTPFTDVSEDAYYYKALLWAVEKGITIGTSATTFSPQLTVTRAQANTFLWRADGNPASATANPFGDVSAKAYYYGAVLWAVEKNITFGTTATTFSPDDGCTRDQIVTFIFRYLGD